MVRVSISDAGQRHRLGGRRRGPALVIAALVFCALGAALVFAGAVGGSRALRTELMERSGATTTGEVLRAVALAPANFLRAAAADAAVERLAIDVKFKHLHTIHEKRNAALSTGVLTTTDDDLVPASIEVGGRTVPVKLRLAGNQPELLEGEKWPLRVRAKGDGHVYGMRRFSLKPPPVRGFQAESLLLEHLKREDVLAPRFAFVDVTLNGKGIGLMALEELPSAELLARQQRRDGPVLRFESDPIAAGLASAIAPLRPGHIARSRRLSRELRTATKLLRAYLAGTLNAGEVFDTELLGRFFAVSDLWGAQDALRWENLRFYSNPLTARLEPIGNTAEVRHPLQGGARATQASSFAARLLEDPRIHAAFVRSLQRIAGEMLTESFAAAVGEQEGRMLRLLHREYPLLVPFDVAALQKRASRLRGLDANLAAANPAPRGGGASSGPKPPLPLVSIPETLARHPFLTWDADANELRAAPGRWDVQGSLILPEGAGLTLPAGTILRFQPRHGLIARGPLTFRGEGDAPVVLEGPAGEKRSQLWSGVYVVESPRPSRWSHVVVRNTAGFRRNGWRLAGGVVFRRARADLEHCTFLGNRSDDALNIVRSSFSLRDVTILESESDGFDGDYVEGTITGGLISGAGGDGIDLGGSRVSVRGTRLANIRDKAMSVGEGSRLSARDVEIEHTGIGLASKNGSEAEIADSSFRDIADVALVAYVNQPEFGPGSLVAQGNRITRAGLPALAQTGSRVLLDGTLLPPVDAAIDRLHKEVNHNP